MLRLHLIRHSYVVIMFLNVARLRFDYSKCNNETLLSLRLYLMHHNYVLIISNASLLGYSFTGWIIIALGLYLMHHNYVVVIPKASYSWFYYSDAPWMKLHLILCCYFYIGPDILANHSYRFLPTDSWDWRDYTLARILRIFHPIFLQFSTSLVRRWRKFTSKSDFQQKQKKKWLMLSCPGSLCRGLK